MSSPDLASSDSLARIAPAPARTQRRGPVVGGLVVVLLVSVALPFVFLPISESVTGSHTAFHILGILTCAAGIILLHLLRRGSTRTVMVLSWIVTVALVGWLVGHVGELFSVFTSGGVAHDGEAFDEATHMLFADIAVPSWMLTILTLLVLLITIAVQAIIRRARAPRVARVSAG